MATKTLIVDDDQSFVALLKIRLSQWNSDLDIQIAKCLKDARAILDKGTSFDLVLLDQHLPDGMGAELFDHPQLRTANVLAVSSDNAPEIPGNVIKAGARHFLAKRHVTEPLFLQLIEAMFARKDIEEKLIASYIRNSRIETIRVLLATLRHEINNPLGAVLGGAYLLKSRGELVPEQKEALRLIEESSHRIKHVIDRLCEEAELEEVTKGQERVFHVPGDMSWEERTRQAEAKAKERAKQRSKTRSTSGKPEI